MCEPYFNLPKCKLVTEIKSWLRKNKDVESPNFTNAYQALIKLSHKECVFPECTRPIEQEFELKNGADKIKKFFNIWKKSPNGGKDSRSSADKNLPKYSLNVLRKICKEWLNALECVIEKSTKTEWEIKDLKTNQKFKIKRKDLVYRCSCLLNEHAGVPCAHILWWLKSMPVEQIIRNLVVHPKFIHMENQVKQELESPSRYKPLEKEINKFKQEIDYMNNFGYNELNIKGLREIVFKGKESEQKHSEEAKKSARKRIKVVSSPSKRKRQKRVEDDHADSLLVNIDPEEHDSSILSPYRSR